MASCGLRQIEREWSVSADLLSDLLVERDDLASIPGDQYSRRVAEAAARAGVRALFWQTLLWQAKKTGKIIGGERYLKFREALARWRQY